MDYYNLDQTRTFLISQKALILEGARLLVVKDQVVLPSLWDLPGGLLEMDEALEPGLKREVREETGLEIAVGGLFGTWELFWRGFKFRDGRSLDARIIGLVYTCQRVGGQFRLSQEHSAYQWVSRDDLSELEFYPHILPLLEPIWA